MMSFSYHISAVLSSSSSAPSSSTFSASKSLSPQVFLDGLPVQASSDDEWILSFSQFSRSFVHIELFGVLYNGTATVPAFSITSDTNVSVLPVRTLFDFLLSL
jgi:hypothetical protein